MTGSRRTFVDVNLAQFSAKTINAQAFEPVGFVQTGASVQARFVHAIVSVDQAVSTFEAFLAFACVTSWSIDTFSAVAAGSCDSTFVDVFIAKSASKSKRTSANVVPEVGGRGTSCSIGAVVSTARVHLDLASFASVRGFADANEIIDVINASTIIFAWPQEAIVDVDFTIFAFEARLAFASVRIEMSPTTSAMLTGV